jgi:hypothetical protein
VQVAGAGDFFILLTVHFLISFSSKEFFFCSKEKKSFSKEILFSSKDILVPAKEVDEND